MGFTEIFGVPQGAKSNETVIVSKPSKPMKIKCGSCGSQELTRNMKERSSIICLTCGKSTSV